VRLLYWLEEQRTAVQQKCRCRNDAACVEKAGIELIATTNQALKAKKSVRLVPGLG
jgi:hypothetical protein